MHSSSIFKKMICTYFKCRRVVSCLHIYSDKSVSLSFARLFSDHENQEVVFTDKFFDILKLFCNSVLRITNKSTASQMSDEDSERYVINERGEF